MVDEGRRGLGGGRLGVAEVVRGVSGVVVVVVEREVTEVVTALVDVVVVVRAAVVVVVAAAGRAARPWPALNWTW